MSINCATCGATTPNHRTVLVTEPDFEQARSTLARAWGQTRDQITDAEVVWYFQNGRRAK